MSAWTNTIKSDVNIARYLFVKNGTRSDKADAQKDRLQSNVNAYVCVCVSLCIGGPEATVNDNNKSLSRFNPKFIYFCVRLASLSLTHSLNLPLSPPVVSSLHRHRPDNDADRENGKKIISMKSAFFDVHTPHSANTHPHRLRDYGRERFYKRQPSSVEHGAQSGGNDWWRRKWYWQIWESGAIISYGLFI